MNPRDPVELAKVILAVIIVSVSGTLIYVAVAMDDIPPPITRGDIQASGSLIKTGVVVDEYAGVGTLEYTHGGDDIEWHVMDLESPAYVMIGVDFEARYHSKIVEGRSLVLDGPGRYSIQLYVDGWKTRTGTVTFMGDVLRTYSWTQDIPGGGSYDYSVTLPIRMSDYLGYADHIDAVRHHDDSLENSRFAVVDDALRLIEAILEDEFEDVRGNAVRTDGQEYLDYLLSFVQCCIACPVSDEMSSDELIYGEAEYWAYPLETLYRGMGDSEDTSTLAAALFSAAGFTAGVVLLDDHMVAFAGSDRFVPYAESDWDLTTKRLLSTGQVLFMCETTTRHFVPVGHLSSEHSLLMMGVDSVSLVKEG